MEAALVGYLAAQSGRVSLTAAAAVPIITLAAMAATGPFWPGLWLTATLALLFLRWALLSSQPSQTSDQCRRGIRIAMVLGVINGCLHAAVVLFFPYFSLLDRMFVTIVLVGMATGAVTSSAGYLPVYACYLVPITLGLAGAWWGMARGPDAGIFEQMLPALILLYGLVLAGNARQLFRVFRESLEMRQEQASLNRQLQAVADEAKAANQAKAQLMAAASHDLRQPIHTLSLLTAALSMRPLDERTGQIASRLKSGVSALSSQLDDLMDVSRLDAGSMEARPRDMPLRALVERVCEEFEPLCEQKSLVLRRGLADEVTVCSDAVLLERVLRNLLSNAIRYTASGTVTVELAASASGGAVLTVADTGPGIPEDEHERIFEAFYRLDDGGRTGGLGLGLSIVQRLSELLDIDVTLHSTVGEGTRFRLTVPDRLSASEPAESVVQQAPLAPAMESRRVLVIDDSGGERTSMMILLDGLDFEVHAADSAAGAVELARRHRFDIALSDLRRQPPAEGVALIQSIREVQPDLPGVLISAVADSEDIRRARAADMRLLQKPLTARELKSAVLGMCPF